MPPYPIQNLTTTAGFKSRNPEVDVTAWSDTTLSGIISTATRTMQNYCQVEGFLTTTVSGERNKAAINVGGDLIIYPRIRPIVSVSAIRLVRGAFSNSVTLSGSGVNYYQIPYPATSLNFASSYLTGVGTLLMGGTQQLISLKGAGVFAEIDYVGGYTTAPEDLVDACDLFTRDIVMRRLNPMGAQEIKQGSFSIMRMTRSSNPKANLIDSVFVQQAKQMLNDGGYVRTASGA